MAREGVDVERSPIFGLDRCPNALSETLVGYSDYSSAMDAGCCEQDSLDLGGVDVGSATEDQRIPAIPDEQSAKVIEIPDVPRIQHSLPNCLGR